MTAKTSANGTNTGTGNGAVRAQYEELPYPARDPADEGKRLITGSPGHLPEMRHHLFAGRLPEKSPFRVLVAGGGTGDALVMIAQQLHDAGVTAQITYIDLSEASRAIAEERARVRGLANIEFVTGSLLDAADYGPFDYIDCCGVLHHLPVPQDGFRALRAALAPDGGMGVMVYGTLGRTGVYHMQEMLRMVVADGPAEGRIDAARNLIDGLPETNWFRKNALVHDHEDSDAGLFDLLLHAQDRSYTVPEFDAEVTQAGLQVVRFIDPARYDPLSFLRDPGLCEKLQSCDPMRRAAFAELYCGNMRKHIAYLTHAGRDSRACTADPNDPAAVPVFRDAQTRRMFQSMPQGAQPDLTLDGMRVPLHLPVQAAAILRAVDGQRSLDRIRRMMPGAPDWLAFNAVFQQVFGTLNGFGKLFIHRPG